MAKKRSNKSAPPEAPPEEEAGFSLDSLSEKLDKCVQLADWVEAAHTHREEFPPDVVKTVLADYFNQYDGMLPGLEEAGTEAADERTRLAAEVAELEGAQASIEAQIDEFKLRKLIGEFTDEDFAAKEEEVRSTFDAVKLDGARASVTAIDDMLSAVGEVRHRIQSIKDPAPADGAMATAESTPAADAPPAEEAAEEPAADAAPAEEPPADELGEEAYNAGGAVQDEWDVEPPAAEDTGAGDGGWNGDGEPAPEPTPDIATSESEDLMATGVIQAQPGIADGPAPVVPAVHSTAEFAGNEPSPPPGDGPRLAVTPPDGEQVIYPFSGDVMSLGRGRNNDIQIKNDGKISRYHCRIFRRGDEFIVEDNKSSNGTLVDGKLVTRQRLEGGEVVQLGETRVQFFAS